MTVWTTNHWSFHPTIKSLTYFKPIFHFYEMFCAIWYHLSNLKNVKNTHGVVLALVKLQAYLFVVDSFIRFFQWSLLFFLVLKLEVLFHFVQIFKPNWNKLIIMIIMITTIITDTYPLELSIPKKMKHSEMNIENKLSFVHEP